jgi:hypothetical protein
VSEDIAAYVDQVEAMLGRAGVGGAKMLQRVAEQHEACADWCAKSSRLNAHGRVEALRAAAAMIRERAAVRSGG